MSESNLTRDELIVRAEAIANDDSMTSSFQSWLNDRYLDAMNRKAWPFLLEDDEEITLAVGTKVYSLPSDYQSMISVSISADNEDLTETTYAEIIEEDPDVSDSGDPTRYYFGEDGEIGFHPTPSSIDTVKLVYHKKVTPLTSNTAPLVPNDFRVAILVNGMLADYFVFADDTRSDKYESKYEMGIRRMIQTLSRHQNRQVYIKNIKD